MVTGRSSQKDIIIGVVECVENLSLDGVEVIESVEAFKLGVVQGGHGKRLQIQ